MELLRHGVWVVLGLHDASGTVWAWEVTVGSSCAG